MLSRHGLLARSTQDRSWLIFPAAGLTMIIAGLLLPRISFQPTSLLGSAANQAVVLIAALIAVGGCLLLRRHPSAWPRFLVAVLACLVSGSLLFSLAHTPYGLWAMDGDQSFRVASMQRFSRTWLPVDFGYRDLPAFFPPLWFWIFGRVGDLLGVPGWQMMRWAQIVTAFLVPLLGFWFWRRVVGIRAAAIVVVLAVLAVPDPVKGDEWLALMIMLPWWLDAFAEVRDRRVAALPAWLHGIIAGLLLLLYTAFFLPAAVATVAVAVVRLRQGRWRALLRRWSVIVGVGLLVWSPFWVPTVIMKLRGLPYQSFQLTWFGDTSPVPDPVELSVSGLLALGGLCWLAWSSGRDRVSRWHAVFVGGVIVIMIGGLLGAAAGHPILVQKTYPMLRYALITAAAVGGVRVADELIRRPQLGGRTLAVLVTVITAVAVTLGLQYVRETVRDKGLGLAYSRALPDGRTATGGPADGRVPADTVANKIIHAAGPDAVLVSDRYDLFATQSFYSFNQFTSHYANPFARYRQRLHWLQKLSTMTDPTTVAEALRTNPYDRVDALVLTPGKRGQLLLSYRENRYPYGTAVRTITFQRSAFDASRFEVITLKGSVLVLPR